jgi:hypothetical protein
VSRRKDVLRLLIERPGLTLREIAAALGFGPRARVPALCAQLSIDVRKGVLQHDNASYNRRYSPTEHTAAALARQRGGVHGNRHAAKPHRLPAKRYASPFAHAPKPASKIVIGKAAPKPIAPPLKRARPAGARETVEEFIARGGKVQVLPNGASAEPLFENLRDRNHRVGLLRARAETESQ